MLGVLDLWLPILVTGIVTHVLSTLFWIVLPHHKPEWQALPHEGEFLDWIKTKQIPQSQYVFPFPQKDSSAAEESGKKAQCSGMLVLWGPPRSMGINIAYTLAFFFVAAFAIAYLSSLALPSDAEFGRVFQFVTLAGLLTHCAGQFPGVFWFRRKVAMDLLDGIAFALATGLVFALLWP